MLWVKAFHIIFMVTWFAGLFYLPRLFVYHAELDKNDTKSYQRFCTMERRLYYAIMTPSGVLTILLGLTLLKMIGFHVYQQAIWMHIKLILVTLLIFYHLYCGSVVSKFKHFKNKHSSKFYRIFNELPAFVLVGAVILVVVRPL